MPILPDVSQRLNLPPMVDTNTTPLGTSYTVPVDHRTARTGITAQERAFCIQEIMNPVSKPSDFVRPGHLFPLIAKEGGVLRRAGHTEAGVDLARLAGLAPAGVLCEILNDDGNRADREQLFALAKKHEMPIITIEDLIRYRRVREKLVERIATAELPTKYGKFQIIAYGVKYEAQQPIVLTMGDLTSVDAPLVRLHSSCFTGDLLDSLRCDCGDQLHMALQQISAAGAGVLCICRKKAAASDSLKRSKPMPCRIKGSTPSMRTWPWGSKPIRAIMESASNCSRILACAGCAC